MSAAFLTPLRIEKIGPRRWLLTDSLVYRSARYAGLFVVPRGFQTDLASVPTVLGPLFPRVDAYDAAGVLHDAAYANALQTGTGRRMFVAKPVADLLFHEAIRALGVGPVRAALMYQAVKRFGDPLGHPLAANRPAAPTPVPARDS